MGEKAELPQYQLQFQKSVWQVYWGIQNSWETHQWGIMDSVTVPVKEYMADYPIRRSLCLLFCQVCIIHLILSISSPSKPLPPLGNSSTICYLCLLVTLWPRGGLLVHTSYQASGQKQGRRKTHFFSKWCRQLFMAKTFSQICYILEPIIFLWKRLPLYHDVIEAR